MKLDLVLVAVHSWEPLGAAPFGFTEIILLT